MAKLLILCGPPGSGKSTYAKEREAEGYVRVSQDDQGRAGYRDVFSAAVAAGQDIVVDRMNFSVEQRRDFMILAPNHQYEIVVFHESYQTCLERMLKRTGHPTIKDERSARAALHTFFTKYERPTPNEFLAVTYLYPKGLKPKAIICDLDGTLCNVEHRRHFVRGEGKKNWKGFFDGIAQDTVNFWCKEILDLWAYRYDIVFCSGRGQEYETITREWLNTNVKSSAYDYSLFMRHRGDHRQDYIVKEIILDFELLTRYTPYLMIDDRQQVVDMWRRRGFVCLQCDAGDF